MAQDTKTTKRVRHIEPNPFHAWAHQTRDWGANSTRTVSFDGVNAYSYRACIGTIVEVGNKRKNRVYLVNSRDYSVTTRNHKSMLRQSIPVGAVAFEVPYLDNHSHAGNVNYLLNLYNEKLGEAKRARKYKGSALRHALNYLSKAREYAKVFKVPAKYTKLPTVKQEAEVRALLPEYERIQEQKEQEETERRRAEYQTWLDASPERAEQEAKLESWLNCESNGYLSMLPYPRMRLNGDTVETTLGANVPLEHVKKLVPMILKRIEAGEPWVPTQDLRLGHYRISRLDADGTLTVGCHRFPKEEVIRFAKVLEAVS